MIATAVLISFSAMPFTAAAQDFDKGVAAYNAGDFAKQYNKICPSCNKFGGIRAPNFG